MVMLNFTLYVELVSFIMKQKRLRVARMLQLVSLEYLSLAWSHFWSYSVMKKLSACPMLIYSVSFGLFTQFIILHDQLIVK